ncbi:hypothetical protein E2C01_047085 [Portunus trituberculatus]|uniref:Uncharacterized protein n=1 Tax=Portunus trituberculatus TaxID=210409 RepID=A0A5B7G6K8_PORTR|nr:hypothetical protein [Portunus trituberculatus]
MWFDLDYSCIGESDETIPTHPRVKLSIHHFENPGRYYNKAPITPTQIFPPGRAPPPPSQLPDSLLWSGWPRNSSGLGWATHCQKKGGGGRMGSSGPGRSIH